MTMIMMLIMMIMIMKLLMILLVRTKVIIILIMIFIIIIIIILIIILPARCVFLAPLAAAAAVNPTRKQSQKTSYNLKHQDRDLDDNGDDFVQRKVNGVWEFV